MCDYCVPNPDGCELCRPIHHPDRGERLWAEICQLRLRWIRSTRPLDRADYARRLAYRLRLLAEYLHAGPAGEG